MDAKQIMFCFIGMISRPRLVAQAVNLRSPKGAPKAQRLTANARAKRQWFAMKLLLSGMRSSLLVAPTKACSINPHAMENHGDLASYRDFGALLAAPLGDSQTPSLER